MTQSLLLDIPVSISGGVTYALPGRACQIESSLSLQFSNDGTTWAALGDKMIAAMFVKSSGAGLITCHNSKWISPVKSYDQTILADSPVMYFRLDETTGTVVTSKTGGYTGTISGGVTLNQSGPVSGGKSMLFDGINGRILISPNYIFPNAGATIECWLYQTVDQQGVTFGVGQWNTGPMLSPGIGDQSVLLQWLGASPGQYRSNSGVRMLNVWNHLAITMAPSGVIFYVNGVKLNTASVSSVPANAMATWAIGYDNSVTSGFQQGKIAECALYDKVLTPAQIQAHYTSK